MSKVAFTAGRIARFKCPAEKAQAFLWDATQPCLGLRTTPSGKPSYVFQSIFQGKTLRMTIGGIDVWTIPQAQERARELQRHIDEGRDPREVKAATIAADVAKRNEDKGQALTVREVWDVYVAERRPHWGDLHYRDHIDKAKPGGLPSGRRGDGKKPTKPGPLAPLMSLPMRELDAGTIEAWAAKEGQTRPSSARLAWRLLTVFLTWCSENPAYASLLPDKNPGKTRKARESLGKPATKSDVLQREQLATWFEHVGKIENKTIAAALQVMLLTGARPGEVLTMRWDDLNTQWKGLTIRDKVDGLRIIPATPYVLHLLASLPRANEWVFASARWVKPIEGKPGAWVNTSATGHIAEPNNPHTRACVAAGLQGLTLHGLRRSFKSLIEWLDVPAGIVAQLMGHKPSATAERHYTVRPLELLRQHHERIEAWMLKEASVQFDAAAVPSALRVIA
jgi:integrase